MSCTRKAATLAMRLYERVLCDTCVGTPNMHRHGTRQTLYCSLEFEFHVRVMLGEKLIPTPPALLVLIGPASFMLLCSVNQSFDPRVNTRSRTGGATTKPSEEFAAYCMPLFELSAALATIPGTGSQRRSSRRPLSSRRKPAAAASSP